jgi:uncharacterized protein YndB with AHSA1/START domain
MVDVLTEIRIAAPVAKVFEYACNPDNAPSWYVNIKSVEWKTSKPARVGTKVAFVAQFLGRRLSYVYEFIELVPGSKLVMRTSEGPFPMETTYTWKALDDHSTQMTLRNKGIPKGFSRLFTPFMKMMMRKANQKDLRRLKSILEM